MHKCRLGIRGITGTCGNVCILKPRLALSSSECRGSRTSMDKRDFGHNLVTPSLRSGLRRLKFWQTLPLCSQAAKLSSTHFGAGSKSHLPELYESRIELQACSYVCNQRTSPLQKLSTRRRRIPTSRTSRLRPYSKRRLLAGQREVSHHPREIH